MAAIRAPSGDGWSTFTVVEAGFLDGASIPPKILQLLAQLHGAGACYHDDLPASRLTRAHSEALCVGSRYRAVGGTNLKWRQHSVWTTRSPIHSESIGTHRSVVTAIGTEDASALTMVCDPYLPAAHP